MLDDLRDEAWAWLVAIAVAACFALWVGLVALFELVVRLLKKGKRW